MAGSRLGEDFTSTKKKREDSLSCEKLDLGPPSWVHTHMNDVLGGEDEVCHGL
jgi:hypothetical protein